ncbi:MAG: hypothetical protein K0S33_867 [Bacteroidetes bacterium]|jgi:hypothetical protein|nr:hypothetical protein [Bacteroidota bacterium]
MRNSFFLFYRYGPLLICGVAFEGYNDRAFRKVTAILQVVG